MFSVPNDRRVVGADRLTSVADRLTNRADDVRLKINILTVNSNRHTYTNSIFPIFTFELIYFYLSIYFI